MLHLRVGSGSQTKYFLISVERKNGIGTISLTDCKISETGIQVQPGTAIEIIDLPINCSVNTQVVYFQRKIDDQKMEVKFT